MTRTALVAAVALLLVPLGGALGAASETAPGPARLEPGRVAPYRRPAQAPKLHPSGPSKPGDELWGGQFGLPSVDGSIYCAVRFGGDLIVGGTFAQIGGAVTNNIARWDGSAWHPLGEGLDRGVTCLAVYQGALFAGGDFQFVGGSFSPHLAKWDGSSWSAVGAFTGSYTCCYALTSLAVFHGELVAGGDFGIQEPPSIMGIRRWDGSTWRSLGDGVDGPVQTMLAVGESLYVAGHFSTAGGAPAAGIALWDGSTWHPLGPGISGQQYYGVRALAQFQDQLFAGGDFDSAGAMPAGGLASWDGASWSSVEGFNPGWVSALGVWEGRLYAARFPGLEQWDGSNWGPASGSPELRGEPRVLLSDDDGLVAAGACFVGDIYGRNVDGFSVARWNGSSWIPFEPWSAQQRGLAMFAGFPANVTGLASFHGKLIAGGLIDYAGTGSAWQVANSVAEWDGSNWRSFGPAEFGIPSGLYAEADTLYAVGTFYTNYPVSQPLLRWGGSTWSAYDTLSTNGRWVGHYKGHLVLATARSSSSQGGIDGVFEWIGNRWVPIGTTMGPDEFGGVYSVAFYRDFLVAAGTFTSIDGLTANGIAAWNGAAWQTIGGAGPSYSYSPTIWSVLSDGDRLFAAGSFPGHSSSIPIEVFDGSSWNPVAGISGYAYAAGMIRGKLFVGGYLTLEPSGEQTTVAMWDGQEWASVGSGTNGTVTALCEHDGMLYVGGQFSLAGGKSSFGIAQWDGLSPSPHPSPPPGAPWLSQGRPNPFQSASDFSFRVVRDGPVRIAVYDARGREVAVLEEGTRPAGVYDIRWDGNDRTGKRAPAGVYFISVSDGSGKAATKVIRLR